MNALQTWNDVIARNIASAPKTGFKAKSVSFEIVPPQTVGAGMPRVITTTNLQQGEIRMTGLDTDFAIKGPGLFPFARPDGQMVYSRDGGLKISREGSLVNKQGLPLMGVNGPILLVPGYGALVAEKDGTLRQGDQEVGRLAIVVFPRPDELLDSTGGYIVDPDNPQASSPVIDPVFKQGALESSNVSSIREMVDMISVNNAFQANQRVISGIDRALERAVEVLGNT